MWGAGCRVQGVGFGVWGVACRVLGAGSRVAYRVWGAGSGVACRVGVGVGCGVLAVR